VGRGSSITILAAIFAPVISAHGPIQQSPSQRLTTAANGSTRRIALHTIGGTWSLPA
jgi:hypothetical protein